VDTSAGFGGRNEYKADLSGLKPGVYILEISNAVFKDSIKLIKK
jgi:hypothetical protein